LLLGRAADTETTSAMPDGGQVEAVYNAGDFGAHWPGKVDVRVTVLLTGRSVLLTETAHNGGDTPTPVGLGWRPRLVLPTPRAQLRLRVPGEQRLERDRATGTPTGRLLPVAGTAYDFLDRDGVVLGSTDIDDTFVNLHQEFLDDGPMMELRDPLGGYGFRMTALTNTIRAIHVTARKDQKAIVLDPQFNFDDPFGREWAGKEDQTGIVVLQPGQTTQWQVRLELFSLAPAAVSF
jgi:galactose mutarotase-like enzyme